MKIALVAILLAFGLGACATSGSQVIQTKCKQVEELTDTWVCQAP